MRGQKSSEKGVCFVAYPFYKGEYKNTLFVFANMAKLYEHQKTDVPENV